MKSSILALDGELTPESNGITAGGNTLIYESPRVDIPSGDENISRTAVTLSISGKEWRLPPECELDLSLIEAAGKSELLAKLLVRRGVTTAEQAAIFLDPSLYSPTSPMEFPDMAKAIVRITQAIAQQEKITVYGDYDVDGVTGTAVLLTVLRKLGASVDHYIPSRTTEGYGLNLKAVSVLASKHRSKLIITCDCGISNFVEINFARSLGVDTIVVDHHSMPELLPPAVATLHPKLLVSDHPLQHLSGVGVAYKLCEALLMDRGAADQAVELMDFVTLGMIADMVPLVQENRYLVHTGLSRLAQSKRPGIQALLARVRGNNGADLVGFGLAPRINAVGRLADANLAVELMITDDSAVAERLAGQLDVENTRRQELCEQIMVDADREAARRKGPSDRAMVLYKEGWHHGVVGIVASRLVEKYNCAVFIGELDPDEGIVKGSARGIEGLDLYAVLKANEQLMIKWGGHKAAAGFSLEAGKAEAFSRAITQTCNTMLDGQASAPGLEIDLVVGSDQVSTELARLVARLAPFGMSNRKPILVVHGLHCRGTRLLGKEGKHSRIMLADAATGKTFESVLWNSKGKIPAEGARIDVACTPEINTYNGQDRLQLLMADWRDTPADKAGVWQTSAEAGAPPAAVKNMVPQAAVSESADGNSGAGVPVISALPTNPAGRVVAAEPGMGDADRLAGVSSSSQQWRDLRDHDDPCTVLDTAVKKLGSKVSVFAETSNRLPAVTFVDRGTLGAGGHLLVWQYPPSLQVFQALVTRSQARHIYLVGGCRMDGDDAPGFLRRLLGVVRFAVNKREGKAEGERVAAALGTTTLAVALGLTILRKVNVVDWFSEDGVLYLDILDQPSGQMEDLPEFRQLADSLRDIDEFRKWCSATRLKDIQLAIVPNHIELAPQGEMLRRQNERYACEDGTVDRRDDPLHTISPHNHSV